MQKHSGEDYDELWEQGFRGQKSWEEILLVQQQNLATARTAGDLPQEASELSDLHFTLDYMGRPQEAVSIQLLELKLRRSLGDTSKVVGALWTLGRTLKRMGRSHSAIRCFRMAGAWFGRLGCPHLELQGLFIVAELYRELGCTEKAREAFQLALPLAKDDDSNWGPALILRALVQLHETSGNLPAALECEQSLAAAYHRFGCGYECEVAKSLERSAHLYLKAGQRWEAWGAFRECMDIFLRIGKRKSAKRAEVAFRNAQPNASRRAEMSLISQRLVLRGESGSRVRGT